jgi:hypothetical protein
VFIALVANDYSMNELNKHVKYVVMTEIAACMGHHAILIHVMELTAKWME